MVMAFSVADSGTNGTISRNPGCFFRMGRTSLRMTLKNSSFFSTFGMNSRIRANMMCSPFMGWVPPQVFRLGSSTVLVRYGEVRCSVDSRHHATAQHYARWEVEIGDREHTAV